MKIFLPILMCLTTGLFAVTAMAAGPAVFTDCDSCPEMVVVPAGRFLMGSSPEDLDRPFLEPDRVTVEQPQVKVTIAQPFAIGRSEVTVGQYREFAQSSGRPPSECLTYNFAESRWENTGHDWKNPGFDQADDHPAVCLTWEDAHAYAAWLSQQTGQIYRISNEAEWEYAARAGTQTLWPWGEEKDVACQYANSSDQSGVKAGVSSAQAGIFDCDDGYVFTAPALFGTPNGFGLRGMIGNAGEWQQDCMVRTHDGAPVDGTARVIPDCVERVMRGGSWFNPPMYSRPAFRYGTLQTQAFNLVGFRLVRELNPGDLEKYPAAAVAPAATARIKRLALQVPDLDRAVVFFRDVIGFQVEREGVIEAGSEPYLHQIFRSDPTRSVRRVLFNTSTEQRGLFVVENPDAAAIPAAGSRPFAAVVEVDSIQAVRTRAISNGFSTVEPHVGLTAEGVNYAEMIVTGPAGYAVLAFEYDYPDDGEA